MTGRDRQLSPQLRRLKADTRALTAAAGGANEVAREGLCRIRSQSVLSDYHNVNTESFMPIDVVAALEIVTQGTAGWPIITRRLATMAGGAFVELPEPGALDANWFEQLGELANDNGRIAGQLCTALADGKVEAREIRDADLIAACDDAILHLVNLRARFERIVEEGR